MKALGAWFVAEPSKQGRTVPALESRVQRIARSSPQRSGQRPPSAQLFCLLAKVARRRAVAHFENPGLSACVAGNGQSVGIRGAPGA